MSVTVNDVLSLVRDYSRNQNLTSARGMRAIESALQLVQAQVGMPGHEREHFFDFFDDDITFATPADFGDPISLRFEDDQLNVLAPFAYRPAEFLYPRVKAVSPRTRLWGRYDAAGEPLIYVLAKNSTADVVIDSFDLDNDTNWTASIDAENIVTDTVTFKEGNASLKFDVDVSLSGSNRASITRTFTSGFDLSTLNDRGSLKCWIYLPSVTNFSSITLSWGDSASVYWNVSATTQQDGSALVVGWNQIEFVWVDASEVGSPDDTNVVYFKFDFDYTGAFSSVNGFRIDFLRVENPDVAIMTYYTTYVGKNSGGTYISTFSATTDTFLFGSIDPGLKQLVALMAAVIINPQILVDDGSVRKLYKDFWAMYARKYPKKIISQLKAAPLVARTTR